MNKPRNPAQLPSRECDDNVALFPHGKWATIQVMQDYLAEAARAELPLDIQRKDFEK
jgi:hypothetical protein